MVETLCRVVEAAQGFRLVLMETPAPGRRATHQQPLPKPLLTPARLYEASLWGSSRLNVVAQLLRHGAGQVSAEQPEHGRWVHAAARGIQRKWRAQKLWRQRVDAADALQVFAWALRSRGLHLVQPEALVQVAASMGEAPMAERRLEPMALRLALAAAACASCRQRESQDDGGSDPRQIFRWLEVRTAGFCARHGVEYTAGLRGLAEPPRCLDALRELTRGLLVRLGAAFPWMLERAIIDEAERVATSAALAANRYSAGLSTAPARRRSFVAQVHSEVMSWVLESADKAIQDLESRFEDPRLAERLAELPCMAKLRSSALAVLRPPSKRPWLVRLEADFGGPVLLLPLRSDENLGGVLRAACAFFGVEHAQLYTMPGGSGEPLPVEATPGNLQVHGVFLPLSVYPWTPEQDSFEYALQEVVKTLGSKFSLDREARALKLPKPKESGGRAPRSIGLGDTVVMPEDYNSEAQYYHFYDYELRRMATVRCSLSTLLGWLRLAHGSGADDADLDGLPRLALSSAEVNPTSLLQDLEQLHGQVRHWLWSTVGSHLQRPRRSCFASKDGAEPSLSIWEKAAQAFGGPFAQPSQPPPEPEAITDITDLPGSSTDPPRRHVEVVKKVEIQKKEETAAEPPSRLRNYSDFLCGGEPEAAPEGAEESSGGSSFLDGPGLGQLIHPQLGPEVVRPVVLSAAAVTAPLLVTSTEAQWVVRSVQQSMMDGTVLLTPNWPAILSPGLAAASGAVGGAALGSVLGPVGAALGSVAGALASKEAQDWLANRPEVFDLNQDGAYVMLPGSDGHLVLHHREVPRTPGPEGMAVAALAQASLRGCGNLWAYAHGEMSGKDVALALVRDVRDGAVVWATCQGVLKALALGQVHSSGALSHFCSAALHNPSPVMFAVFGVGVVSARCLSYAMGSLGKEQLQANVVMTSSGNIAGILVNLTCSYFNLPMLGRAVLTCSMSHAAGLAAYEAWRSVRQKEAQERLRTIAREILGLSPNYDAAQLRHRWRLLARLAHPDKNRRPDAKQTFALFGLCREVLLENLDRPVEPGYFRGLLRRLKKVSWTASLDLPFAHLLTKAGGRQRRRDQLPGANQEED